MNSLNVFSVKQMFFGKNIVQDYIFDGTTYNLIKVWVDKGATNKEAQVFRRVLLRSIANIINTLDIPTNLQSNKQYLGLCSESDIINKFIDSNWNIYLEVRSLHSIQSYVSDPIETNNKTISANLYIDNMNISPTKIDVLTLEKLQFNILYFNLLMRLRESEISTYIPIPVNCYRQQINLINGLFSMVMPSTHMLKYIHNVQSIVTGRVISGYNLISSNYSLRVETELSVMSMIDNSNNSSLNYQQVLSVINYMFGV